VPNDFDCLTMVALMAVHWSRIEFAYTRDFREVSKRRSAVRVLRRTGARRPGLHGRPGAQLADDAGRCARHDLIDDGPAAWCPPRTGDAIGEALWTAGVPVAKVMQPHRQTELPQLRHRRFFEHVGSLGQGGGVAPTSEIAALEDDGVVGTAPAPGGRRKATR
jgi:crotonobetainyl-CoA:carnitine CoA-transferase CaiB-like acyl-CoA transferase